MKYWLEVAVTCDGEAAEAVADVLRPLAHGGSVVLEQLGARGAPEADALEPHVTVKIFLPEEHDTPHVRRKIREALYYLGRLYPIPEPTFRELEERDWAEAWKERFEPFRVGDRLWIRPSWAEVKEPLEADDVVLTLDPGMAFGTGLHPTTQMCLQALESLVKPGMDVLDVGTGSGILAIAAAGLGAGHVLAMDTDAQAVTAARENVVRNRVANQVVVRRGSLELVDRQEWDVVIVNILAPVIVTMLREDDLLSYVVANSGRLLLSGIIDRQTPDVSAAVREAGGFISERLRVRDWVTLIASRGDSGPC